MKFPNEKFQLTRRKKTKKKFTYKTFSLMFEIDQHPNVRAAPRTERVQEHTSARAQSSHSRQVAGYKG